MADIPSAREASFPQVAVPVGRAHETIGCSRAHFWRLLRRGRGPPVVELDGARVIRVKAIDRWLEAREIAAPKPSKSKKAGTA